MQIATLLHAKDALRLVATKPGLSEELTPAKMIAIPPARFQG